MSYSVYMCTRKLHRQQQLHNQDSSKGGTRVDSYLIQRHKTYFSGNDAQFGAVFWYC